MASFQGVLFLVLGVGLLAVDWRALSTGWLPCGPRGLAGRLLVRKADQPLAFWTVFVAYGTAGLWLAVFAVGLLVGHADPLPLH
jgi:hypothetical protein